MTIKYLRLDLTDNDLMKLKIKSSKLNVNKSKYFSELSTTENTLSTTRNQVNRYSY